MQVWYGHTLLSPNVIEKSAPPSNHKPNISNPDISLPAVALGAIHLMGDEASLSSLIIWEAPKASRCVGPPSPNPSMIWAGGQGCVLQSGSQVPPRVNMPPALTPGQRGVKGHQGALVKHATWWEQRYPQRGRHYDDVQWGDEWWTLLNGRGSGHLQFDLN